LAPECTGQPPTVGHPLIPCCCGRWSAGKRLGRNPLYLGAKLRSGYSASSFAQWSL